MPKSILTLVGLVSLALGIFLISGTAALAEGPEDLNAVRARFEWMSKANVVTAGYAPGLECVGNPGGMMGFHAEKYPFNEDNVINALDPEIFLLDENGAVMGIEYETHDVSVPRPSLFGHEFERSEGHQGKEWPHYALHVHFLPDGQFLFAPFNPARRCPSPSTSPSVAKASAELKNASGSVVGSATLAEDRLGYVLLTMRIDEMSPGAHGFHIHAVGQCEPPSFTSAGSHFNPIGKQHGLLNPAGPHAGDLQSLIIDSRGIGNIQVTTDRVTLTPGANNLFDSDGSALVVHASDDDHKTDPTGNAGARLACGVIQAAAPAAAVTPTALPSTGDTVASAMPIALLVGLFLLFVGMRLRQAKAR